jgi:hypothetical protein
LATFAQAAALVGGVVVCMLIVALLSKQGHRRQRLAIGLTLLLLGAVAALVFGIAGLMPACAGAVVLAAAWRAPR